MKNGIDVQYPEGKWKPLTRALKHEVGDLHSLTGSWRESMRRRAGAAKAKKDIVQGLSSDR